MIRAALRILGDVLGYRLSKLEMANMVAAVAIMLALRTPWPDLVVRTIFAAILNLFVYLNNDYCDVDRDLAAGRHPERSLFLKEHRGVALGLQVLMGIVFVAVGLAWSPGLIVAAIAGGGVGWLYSAKLKHVPIADVVAMAVWGVAMTLVAFPLDSALGWALAIQLGLYSACFEMIQVMRDLGDDQAAGVQTTAVRLGAETSLRVTRLLMIASAAYGASVLHRWIGSAAIVAALLPFDPARASTYWNQVRLVQGLTWLGLLAWIYWTGSSAGMFVSLAPPAEPGGG